MSWIGPAIGIGLQAAGTIADIVNQATVNNNNREQLNIQQQLAASQIQAINAQMAAYQKNIDPVARYERALQAGYGVDGAMQLAGRMAPHMVGGVAVGPMLQRTQDGLKTISLGYTGFQTGSKTKPVSKFSLTKQWVESQSSHRPRVPSMSSSVWSSSTHSTSLPSTHASSTSGMIVSDSRPIVFRPGTTTQTWIPGSSV